jgi:peptidoglycan hydrolase-like protein with peptidoglycan-binding domain
MLGKIANVSNDASIKSQKNGSFKDIFFVMLNSCRAGNEVQMYQDVVHYFNPKGVDGIHGSNTTAALRPFQNLHGIKPVDGSKNPGTLKWFGLSQEKDEKKQTRIIQEKLTGFFAGKADGTLGTKTKKSIKNYQRAHPKLNVTGKLDEATLNALSIGKKNSGRFLPKNIVDAMGYKGADITMGFTHKVGWNAAVDWAKSFWENLANGQGINTAASNAQASVDHRKREQFDYNIYTMEGISKETTLHPARYGAVRE